MTNNEFIRDYIKGDKEYAAYCHLGISGNRLINYSTVICTLDRENKIAHFNNKKYSRTTSKIQSSLSWELCKSGYKIIKYEGEDAYVWNYGYCGAGNVTVNDMRRVA